MYLNDKYLSIYLLENLRSMNHFEKLNKANIRIFLRKILVFFEYYGCIGALRLGDNLILYETICI